jgi:predicted outer membrane repeat protein
LIYDQINICSFLLLLDIFNVTFTNNTANSNGGAILIDTTNLITITNSKFYNNTAFKEGGAIYLVQQGLLQIDDCEITTSIGTSVYLAYQSEVIFIRTRMSGVHNASNNIGILCDSCSKLFVSNSTFARFWSDQGSGIYINGRKDSLTTEVDSAYSKVKH